MLMINEAALGRRFFKFLLPHFSTKMSIPRGFIVDEETSENKGEETASLVNPVGKIWNVDLFTEEGTLFFGGEGWRRLAIAHGLSLGELLVFQYKGNNVFRFRVFESSSTFERSSYSAFPIPPEIEWEEEDPAKVLGQPATKMLRDHQKAAGFRFFRTLLPGFCTKMLIPRPYVGYMTTELEKGRRKATIVTPNGKIWHADLFMKNTNLFMGGECWKQFTVANGLQIGQALVFRYRGNLVFSLRVFDAITSTEKIYSSSQTRWVNDENASVVISDDEEPEDQAFQTRRMSTTEGHFEIVIKDYHINHSNVLIPAEFRESCGISADDKVVRIRDPTGRIWSIGLFWRVRNEGRPDLYMTNKWQGFAQANKLKRGDKCNFDLVAQGGEKLYQMKIN